MSNFDYDLNNEIENPLQPISIEIISPLHIGNGNEFQLSDFILDTHKKLVYIIDEQRFSDLLYNKYSNFLEIIENPRYQAFLGRKKIFSIEKFVNIEKINQFLIEIRRQFFR